MYLLHNINIRIYFSIYFPFFDLCHSDTLSSFSQNSIDYGFALAYTAADTGSTNESAIVSKRKRMSKILVSRAKRLKKRSESDSKRVREIK